MYVLRVCVLWLVIHVCVARADNSKRGSTWVRPHSYHYIKLFVCRCYVATVIMRSLVLCKNNETFSKESHAGVTRAPVWRTWWDWHFTNTNSSCGTCTWSIWTPTLGLTQTTTTNTTSLTVDCMHYYNRHLHDGSSPGKTVQSTRQTFTLAFGGNVTSTRTSHISIILNCWFNNSLLLVLVRVWTSPHRKPSSTQGTT